MSNLKDIRESKGLSQSQLANKAEMSVRMLQNYEQGVNNIDGANLAKLSSLAIALECKISDLIEDAELKENLIKLGV